MWKYLSNKDNSVSACVFFSCQGPKRKKWRQPVSMLYYPSQWSKYYQIFLNYVKNNTTTQFLNTTIKYCLCIMYKGVSKRFETSSIDRQPMAVREWVRWAWEQGTSPPSIPTGVAVWALGVAQHECLSLHVPSHLRFQHGRETGAETF